MIRAQRTANGPAARDERSASAPERCGYSRALGPTGRGRSFAALTLTLFVLVASAGPAQSMAPASGASDRKNVATTRAATRPALPAPQPPRAYTTAQPATRPGGGASDDDVAERLRALRERALASTRPASTRPALPTPDRSAVPAAPGAAAPGVKHDVPVAPTPTVPKVLLPAPKPGEPGAGPSAEPVAATTAPESQPTTLPAEAKRYRFDYFDTPWRDVLDDFSRVSGLSIVGDTKSLTDNLTYRSPRDFSYDEALYQLNELLLMRVSKMLLLREENQLVIGRLPDLIRQIPPRLMFNSVKEFEAATLDDHQMALVIYKPPPGWQPIEVIDEFRPRFEDYYGTQVFGDAIILTGMARDHRRFIEVVGQFTRDHPTPPTNEPPWTTITLKQSKASDVQNILRQLYPAAPPRAPRPGEDPQALAAQAINIVADLRNNTLLVKASPPKVKEIVEIAHQLDAASVNVEMEMRVFELANIGADELANALRPVSQADAQEARDPNVFVTPEEQRSRMWNVFPQPGGNKLIVIGGPKGLARAETMIKSFDVAEAGAGAVHVALKHASAQEVAQILTNVFRQKPGRQAAGPVFSADNSGNAIVMAGGRQAQYDEIRGLIEQLDQPLPETQREHLIKLERASPTDVAAALTQLASGAPIAGRRAAGPVAAAAAPKFIGNDLSGFLIVRCDDEDWPRFERLIKELDGQTADSSPIMRTFAIRHAEADEIVAILTPMFTGLPARKGVPPPQVKFTADPRNNAVLVWATPEVLDRIAPMVAELDIPSDVGRVQVIRLENAEAADVAQVLSQTFGAGIGAAARKPGGAPPSAAGAVKITAEPITNSLLVVAPKLEFEQIKSLATEMDANAVGRKPMRVTVPIRNRPATEVADALRNLGGSVGGKPGAAGPGGSAMKIVASGELVILDGPRDDVMKAFELIASIDIVSSGRQVKVYPVTDAEDAAEALRVLMSGTPSPRPTPGAAGAPATRAMPMSGTTQIYPDKYRNVLVVHAMPNDFPAIDMLVEAIEKEIEPVPGATTTVGEWHSFTLKFREAYDLTYDLEDLLSPRGTKGGPQFATGPDKHMLLVKCKPRQLAEVERVVKMFDVPEGGGLSGTRLKVKELKDTISSEAAARLLAAQFQAETGRIVEIQSNADAAGGIEVVDIHEDEPVAAPTTQPVGFKSVAPCVLPATVMQSLALALEQFKEGELSEDGSPDKDDDDESPVSGATSSTPTTAPAAPPPRQPLRIYTTDEGKVVISGEADDVETAIKMLEDIEELPQRRILKIFPIKYGDVTDVAQKLDAIFNERAIPAAAAPQQQQLQPQPQVPQPGKPGQPPGMPGEAAPAGRDRKQQASAPTRTRAAGGTQRIHIVPDTRGRKLFVRAVDADFPLIIAVLKSLDVEMTQHRNIRIFKLINLNAVDTARLLREILGLDQRAPVAAGRRMMQMQPGQPPGQGGQPVEGMPVQGQPGQPGTGQPPGQEGAVASAETTTITPDEQTNRIIAAAPPDTLNLIENIINDLDKQPNDTQPTMKRVPLQFARAVEVANVVRDIAQATDPNAARGGRRGTAGGRSSSVSINADPRTNSVVLAGGSKDVDRVATIVRDLDIDTGDAGQVEIFTVKGDVATMAAALREMYGRGGPGGASDVAITGDAATGSLLVRAPTATRTEIAAKIREMETRIVESSKPRTITLTLADADTVAKKLQEIFADRAQRGGRQAIKIIGVPSTKSVVVQAPDDLYPEIERHARAMDSQPVELDIRSFKLKHAKAVEVVDKLNSLVQQVAQQMSRGQGSDIKLGLFAYTPDPLTNSIIVTGNPVTFMVMEKVLASIDVEQSELTRREVRSYVLNRNVSAQQVAANIQQLFAGMQSKDGIPPPNVAAEPNSNMVLVTATEAQHKDIQQKIVNPLLEAVSEEAKQFRVPLQFARADEAANTLTNYFNQWRTSRGNKPQDTIAIVADMNSNTLLVNATKSAKAVFDEMLATIDVEPMKRSTRTFVVRYAAPWTLATILNQQYQNRASRNPNDQVVASFEDGTSSLVITANEKNMNEIAELIQMLDVPGSATKDTRFIKLEHARADEIANSLNQAWQAKTRPSRADGKYPVQITPDMVGNTLIVTSSEADYQATIEMVKALDVPAPGASQRQTRTYQVKFADPNSIVHAINTSFQPPPGRSASPLEIVRAAADWATGSIVVNATGDKHDEIARLIEEMDKATDATRTSHIIEVVNSDPRDVAQALTNIYNQRQRTRSNAPPVTISAMQNSTKLVVNCNETEYAEIRQLVEQIDQGGDRYSGRSVHTITMPEQVKAKDVADSITKLFGGQGYGGQQGLKAEANAATNTLLVFATEQEFEKINAEVIEKLSQVPPVGTLNIYRVPLKYANADEVARTLSQFFKEMQGLQQQIRPWWDDRAGGGGERALEDRVTITAEAGSNMLIIACTETTKKKIDEMLKDIDSDTVPGGNNVLEMFALKNIDATDMVGILEEYLKLSRRTRTEDSQESIPWWARGPQQKTDEKTVLAGDMRLKVVESMNAIIVVGKPESMPHVRELIARLDVPVETPANSPRMIQLKNANATQLASTLEKAFADTAAARGPGQPTRQRPVIVAESSTNMLIVRAAANDYALIEKMVSDLDTRMTGEPSTVRILPLPSGLDVVDLAKQIEKTLNDAEANRATQIRDYRPDKVSINADLRTNTLIVAASKAKFEEVERLVQQLARMSPSTGTTATFIPVSNSRPEDIKKLIEDMQQKRRTGSRGDAAGRRERALTPARRGPAMAQFAPRYAPLATALLSLAIAQAAPPPADRPLVQTIRPAAPTTQPAPTVVPPGVTTQPTAAPGVVSLQLSGGPLTIQAGVNGLMVIGSEEDTRAISQIVAMLDREVPNAQIDFVNLRNAQAVSLAKSLQDVYTRLEQSRPPGAQPRPEDKVAFIAEPRTNTIYVVATRDKMPDVIALVEKSDLAPAIGSNALRSFVLKHRRVKDVEENLKAVIQMWLKQKGITDTNTIGVSRDDQTNTLFITAGEKDLEEVGKVIQQLDTPPPSPEDDTIVTFGSADIMIVPLRVASADKLAPALTKLIQDASTGQTPTKDFIRRLRVLDEEGNPVAELNIDGPTFIVGDPESNALVVASTRKNLLILREIIKRFDVEPLRDAVDLKVRVLKYADASEVAEQLKKTLDEAKKLTARAGKSEAAGGVPENGAGSLVYNAVVTADPRTNTIILAGKPDTMTIFDQVIDKLDMPGQTAMPIEIIKLSYASSTSLETVLDDLMKKRAEALPKGSGPNAGKTEAVIIKADPRAETLIVAARGDRMLELKELIKKLDIPATALVDNIRMIPLKNSSAADLATKIGDLWTKRAEQRGTGDIKLEKPAIVADERSNSLIVAAARGDFDAIKSLVEKLEALPFGPIADIRILPLKFNSAKDLAPVFKKLFDERAKQREGTDGKARPSDMVAIDADPVTNSILVACSPENFELLRQKLEQLDVETGVVGVVELFMLQNVEAHRAKKTLDDIFKEGVFKPGGAGTDSAVAKAREKVTVSTDDRSNTLIVSASPENMQVVRKIVQQMEDVRTPWNLSNTRFFELQHADAVKVAAQLADFFQKTETAVTSGGREKTDIPVTVIADERSNRILIGGSPDGIARAASLIEKMDTPPGQPSSTIEVYRLREGAAGKIGPMLEDMFKERNQPRGGAATPSVPNIPVTVKVDEQSNGLVISASREDHVLIKNLLGILDRRSNILEQVKLFALKKARAEAIKKILEELYKGGGSTGGTGAGAAQMAVAVTTDPRTNAVVVAGPPGELENIAKLVERLDSAMPIDEAQIAIFPLENADAEKTSELLNDLLTGKLAPGGGTSGGGGGTSQQSEMGSMLISFASRDPRGEEVFYKTIRENVQLSFDERTNAVIVVAPPPTVQLIGNLIKTLDGYKKRDVFVRVFMLRNADAAKTVELLEKVFAQDEGTSQQAEFQQGREIKVEGGATSTGGPTAASQGGAAARGTFGKPKTTFTSDSRTNSVVVAGWPEDIDVAGDIIDQLDSQDIRDRINYVYPLQNAKAEDVVTALDSYFQKETERISRQGEGLSEARKAEMEVSAVSHEQSNQVILSFSPRYQSQVLDIVQQLDTPPPQVMIQALLAEVTLDDRFEMGLEFALQQLRFSETAVTGPNGTLSSSHFDVVGGTDLGAAASSGGLGGFSFTVTGEDFNFLVRALQSDSKLEVLQRPMIMCQDNQEASIIVGQSVPFLRGTQVTDNGQVTSQIEYEDIGVQLDVKPHINPDGFVYLEVKPEISQITPSTIDVGNGIRAPIFAKRNAETTVVVKDGETVVIGGLITTSDQDQESKVPVLGDLPGIGVLFRTTTRTKTKTELLIVLTPRVVRTVEDARRMSIDARDVTSVLTPEQKQSPLMAGLQVRPESQDEVPIVDSVEPAEYRIEGAPSPTTQPGVQPAGPAYGPVAPEYGPFRPVSLGVEPAAADDGVMRPTLEALGVRRSERRMEQ